MKKKLLFFLLIIVTFQISAQYGIEIKRLPVPNRFKSEKLPDGMALFIFKSDFPITAKAENIDKQLFKKVKNKYYKLYVDVSQYQNGTIVLEAGKIKENLYYGTMFVDENKIFIKEGAQPGKIYFFKLEKKKKFDISTKENIVKTIQIETESDALLELHVEPFDLDVNLEPKPYLKELIDKSKPDEGIYYYLITPNHNNPQADKRILTFNAENFINENYDLGVVKPKDKIYLIVSDKSSRIEATLSIPDVENGYGSTVILDGTTIGTIPLTKKKIKKGKHVIQFENPDYFSDKQSYTIYANPGEQISFDDYSFSKYKKVWIRTKPEKGAYIYIDGQLQGDKSDLQVELTKGKHTIMAKKDNFSPSEKTVYVDETTDEIIIPMERTDYPVLIESDPEANILVDGTPEGQTPETVNLQYGKHQILFKRKGYIPVKKSISVNSTTTSVSAKLYPSSFTTIGINYGLKQVGFDATIIYNRLVLMGRYKINRYAEGEKIEEDDIKLVGVEVADQDDYTEVYGKLIEKTNNSFGGNLGYLFVKPFPFVIYGGVSFIKSDAYYPVYQAKNDYVDNYGNVVLSKGELFSTPKTVEKSLTAYHAGMNIFFAKILYLGAEYSTDSLEGPGMSYNVGIIFNLADLLYGALDAYKSSYGNNY